MQLSSDAFMVVKRGLHTRPSQSGEIVQQMVDRLGAATTVAEVVEEALRIVSRALAAETAGYFEVSEDGLIRLRYWLSKGDLISRDALELVGGWGSHEAVQILTRGFTVPSGYLDMPVGHRTRPFLIDHYEGTLVSIFDEWLIAQGCGLELNIPILMRGRDAGTLCVLREISDPFTPEEIDLADNLGKALALTIEITRLVEKTLSSLNSIEILESVPPQINNGPSAVVQLEHALDQRVSSPFSLRVSSTIDGYILSGDHFSLSVACLAREFGYSSGHFSALFRENFGVTPHTYILNRKLDRAKSLLQEGRSVSWVAEECGFCDHAHLSRRFKERFGIRPSELCDTSARAHPSNPEV